MRSLTCLKVEYKLLKMHRFSIAQFDALKQKDQSHRSTHQQFGNFRQCLEYTASCLRNQCSSTGHGLHYRMYDGDGGFGAKNLVNITLYHF